MSQPSVTAYFNTRKRVGAADELTNQKVRRLLEQPNSQLDDIVLQKAANICVKRTTRSSKRAASQPKDVANTASTSASVSAEELPKKKTKAEAKPAATKQTKLVQFIKKGPLSPRKATVPNEIKAKLVQRVKNSTLQLTTLSEQCITNSPEAAVMHQNAQEAELSMRTPTKQIIKGSGATPLKPNEDLKSLVRKELNFEEVKTKLSRSEKLQQLKASLNRIQELEKTRKEQEERNRRLREGLPVSAKKPVGGVQLKEFDTIEVEILTSPAKTFKTPTKLPPKTPDKNELMSPRHTNVAKRLLFSPSKDGSPAKVVVPPAYQRFMSLAETSKAGQLPLPFKYRQLIEVFKALDSVCAMFHNRKECITFKKLKPAVQRMLRKNFTETHLAQIKQVFPEAFLYSQTKMRNYGSASKADYFQLVIVPNVENSSSSSKASGTASAAATDAGDHVLATAQSSSMNPHVMTARLQIFQQRLLERVRLEHDRFLKSLDPPICIPPKQVTRWHPEFDLENCADIERAHLPQPPNVEKYSSAHDILSTARNLFNCATPIERAMQRYEASMETKRLEQPAQATLGKATQSVATESNANATTNFTATLLKGVPQSLLERIRAKQAAKAMDAMTRRPSQDQEAAIYSRLPELARYLRNVFISERKSVLTQENIIKKIQNSFRTSLTLQEIEKHLQLLAKEVPDWLVFHEVRKTIYLKINKDMDMSKVVERLEVVANEKSQL